MSDEIVVVFRVFQNGSVFFDGLVYVVCFFIVLYAVDFF